MKIYDEKIEELDSLEEKIVEKINHDIVDDPSVIEQIDEADLVEELLLPFSGETIGEA